ncbi:MAG: protein kinase [Planctomycetota bacterium]
MTSPTAVWRLFDQAIDVPSSARERFLMEHGPDDATVREVQELIVASDSSEGRVLDESVERRRETIERLWCEHRRPTMEVNGYRLRRRLGAGGMGVVFEAEQPLTRRTVALKLLHPQCDENQQLALDEIQLLARLNHPNIAQVYHGGLADLGAGPQPFIVMELVTGETIDRYVATRRLSRRQLLDLIICASRAVAHCHERGVVHCDLKPANILVTTDGQPKILDFGVARLSQCNAERVSRIAGTPPYMSPEQRVGAPIDRRSDVYALGAIAREITRNSVPRLEPVIRRATNSSAERRFASCHELIRALVMLSRADSRRRYCAAALLGLLVTAATVLLWPGGDRLPAGTTGVEAAAAQIQRLTAAAMQDGGPIQALDEDAERSLLKSMSNSPESLRRTAGALTRIHISNGRPELARRTAPILAQLNRELLGPSRPATVLAVCQLSQVLEASGRTDDALRLIETWRNRAESDSISSLMLDARRTHFLSREGRRDEALDLGRSTLDRISNHRLSRSDVCRGLRYATGMALLRCGDDVEAEATFRELESDPDASRRARLQALRGIGGALWLRGEFVAAEKEFREAVELSADVLGRDHLEHSTVVQGLGVCLRDQGRLAEARPYLEEALRIKLAVYDAPDCEVVANSQVTLANLLYLTGETNVAYPLAVKSLETRMRFSTDPLEKAESELLVGLMRVERGDPEGCDLIRSALQRRHDVLHDEHWLIAQAGAALGRAEQLFGSTESAERLLINACERLESDRGATHPWSALAKGWLRATREDASRRT